ncbi:hypothetical protein QYE76_068607 [Lolium multiflorum]|uniref:Ribonuclease H1 N-terminal domain-containing protein n=1 Tax=Lolium multiflorum TaxID=4521 RepID=A0AAD8SGL8_LOLMU|nr:hypothetical protein QYE76_068607 [Lolium multiflorum]
MLPEHVLKLLTGDMASLHNQVQYLERQLLKSKNPSYPLFVAKVPTGMNFVEKYPADLCFIRFNDIFSIYRMQMLHFSVVRLVALSLSSQIVKEGTPTIAIMDPFYMRESIICTRGSGDCHPADMYCTLIVVHPQHSHAVYLDSGRDKKKDYTNIGSLSMISLANKAGPLKVERKSRGGLVLTHTTNFPCLRQSNEDNGMDAWPSFRCRNADDICRVQGRVPGVYDDWEDCRRQVHRFSGNNYKGYPTRVEAEGRYARYLAGEMRDMRRNRMKTMAFVMMVIVTMLVMFYVIVV